MRYVKAPTEAEYFDFEAHKYFKIDGKGFLWYWNENTLNWVEDKIIPRHQINKMIKRGEISVVHDSAIRISAVLFFIFFVSFFFITNSILG